MRWMRIPLLLCVLAGCASQNDYVAPETGKPTYSSGDAAGRGVPNEPLVVDRARATLWRQLIAATEKTSFVVEGADQSTWTLRLRYTGEPREYIDCGRVTSKVKTAKGERNYDFAASKAYQQYELQRNDKLYLVDRRMNIDVRAMLVLESVAPAKTRVKLDSSYTVTRDQAVQGGGGQPFAMVDKINFKDSESATFPNAATKCRATGQFESDVMGLLRR